MSRQFATMIGAGLSLLRSLSVLAEQTENKRLAETMRRSAATSRPVRRCPTPSASTPRCSRRS